MKLILSNFKEVVTKWKLFYHSLELPDECEICLEHCRVGFDVVMYDNQRNVLIKKCTNIENYHPVWKGRYTPKKTVAINMALDIASEMIEGRQTALF